MRNKRHIFLTGKSFILSQLTLMTIVTTRQIKRAAPELCLSKRSLCCLSLLLLLSFVRIAAQSTVTATYQMGVGQTNILDTYLSQEKFSGPGLTFLMTRERHVDGKHWFTSVEHQLNMATTDDRADMRNELQADYSLFVGRYHEWTLSRPTGLKLQVGGVVNWNLGAIYNTSNSNNPAQARLSLNLMPSAAAAYPFRLFGKRWSAQYKVELPLAGVMFSPNYGQSYYEIFSLGNYDHNVVPVTFISAPNLRQQLSVECSFSPLFTMRLGYLGDYQQAEVNNLKSHVFHHRVMIGFVRKFSIINHAL